MKTPNGHKAACKCPFCKRARASKPAARKAAATKKPRVQNGSKLNKWHTAKAVRVRRDKSGALLIDIRK